MNEADKTLVATLLASALSDAEDELQRQFKERGPLSEQEIQMLRRETYVAVIKLWMGNSWKP